MTVAGLLVLAMLSTLSASSWRTPPDAIALPVWKATASGGEASVLVLLEEQADLSGARALPSREARQRYVYDTLRTTALRSQAALRAELDAAGVTYRPFYVANMIALRGDRILLARLASRPEVAQVVANPSVQQTLPEPKPDALHSQAAEGVEWNVERVNADDVWALGYTGQAIVVAGQDTGYDWDHPALIDQYRGYNGVTVTHDYNWHDAIHSNNPHTSEGNPCGFDVAEPCDDGDHGTHTMGTMVGHDGAGNQIGVAPGAQWIGCRNMEEGWGTPATYAECFEFFLAPYPVGGDPFTDGEPSLAPHVINNSWTCPPSEGCDWDTLQGVVENVRAAGILVAAAAGNYGPSCCSVTSPPAIYDAAFSVGATSYTDEIASFSSRGPVTVDGSGRRKPNVSAPGMGIRSSVPDGEYGWKNGTSMAGPHVAGCAALLWSAAPQLLGNVGETEEILELAARPRTTAVGCGGDRVDEVPNNVYGWGIVDAVATVYKAGLSVAIEPDRDPAVAGGLISDTLRVTNIGTRTTTAVITYVPPARVFPAESLTWMVADMPPNHTWSQTVSGRVDRQYEGVLTRTLKVSTSGGMTAAFTGTIDAVIPRLALSKHADTESRGFDRSITYTLSVTNTCSATLNQVVLTDRIPVSTTFVKATGDHELGGDVVTWTAESLPPWGIFKAQLRVLPTKAVEGSSVVNDAYGVRAAELFTRVVGSPVEIGIPWRIWLPLLFKEPSAEGR